VLSFAFLDSVVLSLPLVKDLPECFGLAAFLGALKMSTYRSGEVHIGNKSARANREVER
jgi:hypothetical protein